MFRIVSLGNPESIGAGCRFERKESIGGIDSMVRIIPDQQMSIDIKVICQSCQMAGSGDGNTGFNHAANHRFQVLASCLGQGIQRMSDPSGLNQLGIDTVKTIGTQRYILNGMERFIGNDGKR
jgi:hypothetical protein